MQEQPQAQAVDITDFRWGLSAPVKLKDGTSASAMGTLNLSVTNPSVLENSELTEQASDYVFQIIQKYFAAALSEMDSAMDAQMHAPELADKVVPAANEEMQQYGIKITSMQVLNVR